MAVTKIHSIKSTVCKAIKYILDPAKTDGTLLASGFNCEPATAHLDFQMTALLGREIRGDFSNTGGADNLAYHLIQSFSKTDKITPEQAHEIGKQLADELFQGKHEYVIATHIDKGHVHNHIIVNAVSFSEFTKFRTQPYKTARAIREISDKLCIENGLHVIGMPQGRRSSKKNWQAQPSWRDRLQLVIDNAIYEASSYQEFLNLLRKEGVEVKEGKHIAFRMPGQQRFIRGKSIGPRYEREQIKSRIISPYKRKAFDALPYTKLEKKIFRKSRQQSLREIKELSEALVTSRRERINSFDDFDLRLSELKGQCKNIKQTIKELDAKNARYREATKQLVAYNKYLPLAQQYENLPPWKKKRFMNQNEAELRLFTHAQNELSRIGAEVVNIKEALEVVKRQSEKTRELQIQFRKTEERIKALDCAKRVITRLIGQDQGEPRDSSNRATPKEKEAVR
jgi:hypothetical protein